MRWERWAWTVVAGATLAAAIGGAAAADLARRYRVRRLSGVTDMAGAPTVPDPNAPDCGPVPGVPELLGAAFDPGRWDQIDLAGNGRVVAYASNATAGSPGTRAIVLLREGAETSTVAEAAGDDDQPSVQFDAFGLRMAFRGSTGAAGSTPSNVYLHTVTRGAGDDAGDETVNLTGLDTSKGRRAFDPAIAARVRSRGVTSGIEVRERDARVVFVSNGDLDKGPRPPSAEGPGRNPANLLQVFLWREQAARFEQLTANTDATAAISRPTISGDGRFVVFESNADLDPAAVNPRDPSQVGNPDRVRQLYLWRETRRGGDLRQITWSDRDCLAPRMTSDGRHVLFCSRGDLLPGGNPDGNFEVFRWSRGRPVARRLAQLTETDEGDSVLPRPLRNVRRFVFYSTAMPPLGGLDFGGGPRQCGPSALLWTRGRVRHVAGLLDAENLQLVIGGSDPVFTGPPAAVFPSKIHFATNDPVLDPPERAGAASAVRFHMARATRFRR